MKNFVINLFIPCNDKGSDSAIIAQMYAYAHQGTVFIVRCMNDDEANIKVQELLHHITMADGYNAPQPEHREIWIVGLHIKEMVNDELTWFKGHKEGRYVLRAHNAITLYERIGYHNLPASLAHYFSRVCISDSNYSLLRKMLDPEDYEHLVSYLLWEHPKATDITKEDYVLNMFIEHEKKRIK